MGLGYKKIHKIIFQRLIFFSSGFLLHSCYTISKSGALGEVQGILEGARKMRRKTETGDLHAAAKKGFINLVEAYLPTVFQIERRHGVHSRSSCSSLISRLEQKREGGH